MNWAIQQPGDVACINTISHVTETLGIANWASCAPGREVELMALTRRFHEQLSRIVNNANDGAATAKLAPREVMILKKAQEGKTAKETAQDLCVSEHTVNKQRSNIMAKLHTKNLAQTVSAAEAIGLI